MFQNRRTTPEDRVIKFAR